MKNPILAVFLILTCCTGGARPYDRLCALYQAYSPASDDAVEGMQIYERVQNEIPEVLPVYDIVVRDGIDTRYGLLREAARNAQKQPNWECEALKKHWPPGVRK